MIRDDILGQTPWVAQTIYKGLDQARERCVRRLCDATASAVPMPWIFSAMNDSRAMYGGHDLWTYGVEENRTTLETFARYCYDQGVADCLMSPEDLFFENTSESFKV